MVNVTLFIGSCLKIITIKTFCMSVVLADSKLILTRNFERSVGTRQSQLIAHSQLPRAFDIINCGKNASSSCSRRRASYVFYFRLYFHFHKATIIVISQIIFNTFLEF